LLSRHLCCSLPLRSLSASSASLAPALPLVLLLAACGGSSSGAVATPKRAPSPTPTLDVPARLVGFAASDGARLSGTLYGQGTQAVILSNEGDNASAPWQPIARQLVARGYLVLSYAYRPVDANYDGLAAFALSDLRGAVAFLRTRPIPITRLILIGASLGALEEVKVAATTPCDGLVVISSPLGYQDVQISDANLARLRMPKLFVTSADNAPFTADTLHMFDEAPPPKVKFVYPGNAHGVALFAGESGPALLSAILEFVQRTAPLQ
jgi:pimeloyl-ACP methyl ester carboxylesterase